MSIIVPNSVPKMSLIVPKLSITDDKLSLLTLKSLNR